MLKIARHTVENIDFVVDELDYIDLEKDFKNIQSRPKNLGSYCLRMIRAASICELAQLPHEKTIEYLQLALVTGLGHFRSALNPGSAFTIEAGNRQLSIRGVETTAFIDPSQWQKLFHLAVILRDMDCLKALCNIPESFMRKGNIKGNEVDFTIVRFYKSLFNEQSSLEDVLIEAIKSTNPDLHEGLRLNYIFYIEGPELDLYTSIFSSQLHKCNEYLAKAIELYRQFWGEGDKRFNHDGWLSYALTAAAVIAYDTKKYSIEVDSPYVPLWLVKREFN